MGSLRQIYHELIDSIAVVLAEWFRGGKRGRRDESSKQTSIAQVVLATWAIRSQKRRLKCVVTFAKQAHIEHLSQSACILEKKKV